MDHSAFGVHLSRTIGMTKDMVRAWFLKPWPLRIYAKIVMYSIIAFIIWESRSLGPLHLLRHLHSNLKDLKENKADTYPVARKPATRTRLRTEYFR